MPLWGVLDISFLQRKYELLEAVLILRYENYFKEYGFKIGIIDEGNFIQKQPYFYDNEEFIKKNNLYFNDKPCYYTYLKYMRDNIIK